MGHDQASRFSDLFAERQVYLRTGQTSQYVVLSRSLQLAVAVTFCILVAGVGLIAYVALTSHFQAYQQARQLAQLQAANRQLATEAEAGKRLPALTVALEQSEMAAVEARQQAEKAVAEVTDLMTELERGEAQIEDLRGRLSEAQAEQAALTAKLDAQQQDGTSRQDVASAEVAGLRSQLETVYRQVENLRNARDDLRKQVETATLALQEQSAAAMKDRSKLEAASAENGRLRDLVQQAESDSAQARAEMKDKFDTLRRQIASLTTARNGLQARVDELTAQLDGHSGEFKQQTSALASARAEIETLTRAVVEADAARQAEAIAHDLAEAEMASQLEQLTRTAGATSADGANGVAMAALRDGQPGARKDSNGGTGDTSSTEQADGREIMRLGDDLAGAQGKLRAPSAERQDARAQQDPPDGQAQRQPPPTGRPAADPDQVATLQAELATARKRLTVLNDALADAKLREVAFELALVSVVPSPSPPAPR